MKKFLSVLLLAVSVCMLAAGCSIEVEEQQTPDKYSFYYLNAAETTLEREAYEPKEESADFMVRELMQSIGNRKVPEDGIALLPEEVILNSYDFQDSTLVIDFKGGYREMSRAREVLTRAGIVLTFLQIPEIEKVRFTLEGQELTDSRNNKIGEMTRQSFLNLSGKNMDSYRYDTFTLYFMEEGHYPVISESSVALSAIIADRICYIDMNRAFQEESPDIAENVQVYAVVNSLLDSCEADKVQISIEGNMEGNLKTSMPLYTFYQKNEELVEQEDSNS